MVTAPVVQKKSDYCVYCAYNDYCAKTDIIALEKVAFLRAKSQIFSAFGAKYGISKIIELNHSVV